MKNRRFIFPIAYMIAGAVALQPAFAVPTASTAAMVDAATPSGAMAPGSAFSGTAMTPASGATASAGKSAPAHTMPYTVLAGDTLTKLADKFNTTRKKLKSLNDLASTKLTPGQVIFVPGSLKSASKTATASAAKTKHHASPMAQPVQDFDIPASTFAGCPVPPPLNDEYSTPPGQKPALVAQLVSPAEMAADQKRREQAAAAQAPSVVDGERLTATIAAPRLSLPAEAKLSPMPTARTAPKVAMAPAKVKAAPLPAAVPTPSPAPSGWASNSQRRPTPAPVSHGWSLFGSHPSSEVGMNTPANNPANAWGYKFLQEARSLGDRGIDYDDDWRPPGERTSWTMDCSNTSRWLYKSVANINLPRTASDQYYYLHLQGKAWDVPTGSTGWADVNYLQKNLKPGDLLFWENTYRPERQPPITHVMVFLGTNDRGQWIMAGSQSSRGGEHNRRNGGPDIYIFRPSQACGGYSTWLGMSRHVGRFCAFGRPLEADPSKLAAND